MKYRILIARLTCAVHCPPLPHSDPGHKAAWRMGWTERKLATGERKTRVDARFKLWSMSTLYWTPLLQMHLLRSIHPLTNVKLIADILSGAVSLYDCVSQNCQSWRDGGKAGANYRGPAVRKGARPIFFPCCYYHCRFLKFVLPDQAQFTR